ncbi:MAG: acylphosphatase [Nitrospina sp.]|jgi:acylphosphatase|nr:acylphosphatase [Nitrospina sp.]
MVDVAVHIIIHGKVHGVCFRASTQIKALELNLIGWVRNLPSGTVEVHAEGSRDSLDKLIKWCQKGPPSANVSRCDLDWVTPQSMDKFRIL